MSQPGFEQLVRNVYQFLEHCGTPYLIIGGLATSVLGEPRLTLDFDLLLFVQARGLSDFLDKAKAQGFQFDNKQALADAKERLCFAMRLDSLHIDCLIAATAFEAESLSRAVSVKIDNHSLYFPSPEDFILLKLIVGREKDFLDAKAVALRHKNNLGVTHMEKWAQAFKEARQDSPVWGRLQKLLNDIR